MTFDILLVALAALVLSNVVLLVAAARSGALHGDRHAAGTEPGPPFAELRPAIRPVDGVARERPMSAAEVAAPEAPAQLLATHEPAAIEPAAIEPAYRRRTADPAPAEVLPAPVVALPAPVVALPAPVVALPAPVEPGRAESPPSPAIETATGSGEAPAPASQASSRSAASAARHAPGPDAGRPEPSSAAARARTTPDSPPTTARGGSRGAGAARAGETRSGRGRRFTLPSIEVDHARTERVVLSLLTGDDEVPPGEMVDAWERMVGTDADSTGRRSAVVVALTLDGLDRLTEATGRESAERIVGTVLDAIRRSARGSDRVASVGRGHFRVLLVDADEAVATRFVGRVRESTERRLVMAAAPVTLAAGWSEAASADRLEGAVRAAEERRRADADSAQRRTGGSNPA